MSKHEYDIFISYRREDGAQYARILQLELEKRDYRVFLDYEELTDGVFGDEIKEAIKVAPIFIMVLTPQYLVRSMEDGSWVREEISLAIDLQRHLIPVDPDKRFNGIPDNTPSNIADIVSNHQHSTIDFGQALGVTIDLMVKNRIAPYVKSSHGLSGGKWKWLAIAILSMVLLAAATAGGYYLFNNMEPMTKYYSESLSHAAHANDRVAQYYMGIVLENGYGISVDVVEAVKWYEKAAQQGMDSAQVNLALCYLEGNGVEKNDSSALYWLHQAINQGNSDAMVNLGVYFFNAGNEQEGKEWLQKAMEKGNQDAKRIMEKI
jgi:tetratricopeptide (TPR) repeat protein